MSPRREICFPERVALLQSTVQPILTQLHKGDEFRWTSRYKALLLEGIGLLLQAEAGDEASTEPAVERLLLLYGQAVDTWSRERPTQPVPDAYLRLRSLVRRAGGLLWTARGKRLSPIEYLRLGRHFCGQGPPEVREPWFRNHPGTLREWVKEILAAPSTGTAGVPDVDLALTAAAYEEDWDLAAEIAEQEVLRNTARYVDLFEALRRAGRTDDLLLAVRRALAEERFVGPAVRGHAEVLLSRLYDDTLTVWK